MKNTTVLEWNDEIIVSMIPNLFVLSLYLLVGICGNVLVLMVYAFSMRNSSDERYFIPILAACDLIATLYHGSVAIYNSINQVTFSISVLCKTMSFFSGFATFQPICVLLVIAIQRYFKICLNLNPSKTILFKRISLVLANLFSVIVASPLPFVNEIIPVHHLRYNITGMRCGTSPKENILARNVYVIIVGLFAVATGATFTVLYFKIAHKIFVHFKSSTTQNDTKIKEFNIEENKRENNVAADYKENQENPTEHELQNNSHEENNQIHQKAIISKQTGSAKRRIKDRGITYRMAIMFFVITLLFFICYIPKLILVIISGIHKDFLENLSTSQRSGVMFVNDMFIINNIVNPFIYAFMDTKFRLEAKILFKRAFNC